jgi:hypothetical protein
MRLKGKEMREGESKGWKRKKWGESRGHSEREEGKTGKEKDKGQK